MAVLEGRRTTWPQPAASFTNTATCAARRNSKTRSRLWLAALEANKWIADRGLKMERLASVQVAAHAQEILPEVSEPSIPRDAGKPGWPAKAKPLPNHVPAPRSRLFRSSLLPLDHLLDGGLLVRCGSIRQKLGDVGWFLPVVRRDKCFCNRDHRVSDLRGQEVRTARAVWTDDEAHIDRKSTRLN